MSPAPRPTTRTVVPAATAAIQAGAGPDGSPGGPTSAAVIAARVEPVGAERRAEHGRAARPEEDRPQGGPVPVQPEHAEPREVLGRHRDEEQRHGQADERRRHEGGRGRDERRQRIGPRARAEVAAQPDRRGRHHERAGDRPARREAAQQRPRDDDGEGELRALRDRPHGREADRQAAPRRAARSRARRGWRRSTPRSAATAPRRERAGEDERPERRRVAALDRPRRDEQRRPRASTSRR